MGVEQLVAPPLAEVAKAAEEMTQAGEVAQAGEVVQAREVVQAGEVVQAQAGGVKCDRWIRERALEGMIEPFCDHQVRDGVISYGLSSYGYDLRVADQYKIFTNVYNSVVDPKRFDERSFVDFQGPVCTIPPNSFALARTFERLRIPRNVMTICVGKSTYARCGIILNVTPLEPEWEGYATLEISNTTPLPAKIYSFEGICQLLFFDGGDVCERSYADKDGKYQGQIEVTPPRL